MKPLANVIKGALGAFVTHFEFQAVRLSTLILSFKQVLVGGRSRDCDGPSTRGRIGLNIKIKNEQSAMLYVSCVAINHK